MKQKFIYCMLLVTALYIPASSKECAKLVPCAAAIMLKVKEKIPEKAEDSIVLPVSPFSRLLFNL